MEVLYEDSGLKISAERRSGASDCVIAFAGMGNKFAGAVPNEFARSLSQLGPSRDQYFIVDKQRTWFNATSDRILEVLREEVRNRPSVMVGNSMGGFGALLLSSQLSGCRGAVAFVPQFSVHPEVVPITERRAKWVEGICSWRHRTCEGAGWGSVPTLSLFGDRDVSDGEQMTALLGAARDLNAVVQLHGMGHDAAATLRVQGLLHPLLGLLLDDPANVNGAISLLEAGACRVSAWLGSQAIE